MNAESRDSLYAIATLNVVSEVFDQEVVVINLTSGVYYNLSGSAPAFWAALQQPVSSSDLDRVVADRFDADRETVRSAGMALLDELRAEGLVVELPPGTPVPQREPPVEQASGVFVEPVIERFDDLQELIKLDPVHDIAAALPAEPGTP
jgi:hypothetical protein